MVLMSTKKKNVWSLFKFDFIWVVLQSIGQSFPFYSNLIQQVWILVDNTILLEEWGGGGRGPRMESAKPKRWYIKIDLQNIPGRSNALGAFWARHLRWGVRLNESGHRRWLKTPSLIGATFLLLLHHHLEINETNPRDYAPRKKKN